MSHGYIQQALGGDRAAVERLIELLQKSEKELAELKGSICKEPIAAELLNQLSRMINDRGLDASDRSLASEICMELADAFDSIKTSLNLEFSTTPRMMDRVVLFKNESLEVRAHLFFEGVDETYVHSHGQSFISVCLSGKYNHKLHTVNCVDNAEGKVWYKIVRKPGGLYSEEADEQPGDVETVLSQPFAAGQSLFLSALAYHTVECDPASSDPLVTVVFRSTIKRFNNCNVISNDKNSLVFDEQADEVQKITDPQKQQAICDRLHKAFKNFKIHILSAEPIEASVAHIRTKVDLISTGLDAKQQKEEEQRLLKFRMDAVKSFNVAYSLRFLYRPGGMQQVRSGVHEMVMLHKSVLSAVAYLSNYTLNVESTLGVGAEFEFVDRLKSVITHQCDKSRLCLFMFALWLLEYNRLKPDIDMNDFNKVFPDFPNGSSLSSDEIEQWMIKQINTESINWTAEL